jgi:anthranilate phosphoribosyltransferase
LQTPDYLRQFIETLQARSPLAQSPLTALEGVDICGTGGSGLPRVNTSTLSGLLLASQGLPILKHGNRAASGRYGSFDLLADLGLDLAAPADTVLQAFRATGLALIFAPMAHPIVGKFGPTRARMAVPTIFNILGPLLNPANPARQLIGTAFGSFMELIRDTAVAMGKSQVYVVRGADGLDEISVSGPTRVVAFEHGESAEFELRPEDFGITAEPLEGVLAEKVSEKQRLAKDILAGQERGPHRKLILVNAAFAYQRFHAPALSLADAYAQLDDALARGDAAATLEQYIGLAQNPSPVSNITQ